MKTLLHFVKRGAFLALGTGCPQGAAGDHPANTARDPVDSALCGARRACLRGGGGRGRLVPLCACAFREVKKRCVDVYLGSHRTCHYSGCYVYVLEFLITTTKWEKTPQVRDLV